MTIFIQLPGLLYPTPKVLDLVDTSSIRLYLEPNAAAHSILAELIFDSKQAEHFWLKSSYLPLAPSWKMIRLTVTRGLLWPVSEGRAEIDPMGYRGWVRIRLAGVDFFVIEHQMRAYLIRLLGFVPRGEERRHAYAAN